MELYYPPFASSEQIKKAANDAPPLKKGSTGLGVKMLQIALAGMGYEMKFSKTGGEPNGIYDDEVHKAVAQFQADHGMMANGVADSKTIIKLDILADALIPKKPKAQPAPPKTSSPRDFSYKIGTGRPVIFPDKGAGIHNSKNQTKHMWALKQLILETLPPRGSSATTATGEDAAQHLKHYFEGNGPLTIKLEKMIRETASARGRLLWAAQEAQKFCNTLPPGTHNIVSTSANKGYNNLQESKNWFYAVGGYSTWAKGVANISPNEEVILDFEYHFVDRYNWDGGKSVNIFGLTITDEFMGEFHLQGYAKEYDMSGVIRRQLSWKKGQELPANTILTAFHKGS